MCFHWDKITKKLVLASFVIIVPKHLKSLKILTHNIDLNFFCNLLIMCTGLKKFCYEKTLEKMAMEKGQEMRNEGNHDPRTDLVT